MKKLIAVTLIFLPLFGLWGCSAPEAPPQLIELTVTDPPSPEKRVEIALGAEVTLRITTPTDDAVHVHGYELEQELTADSPTDLTFKASMAGTFEVESHVTDSVWLVLVVS